MCILWALCTFTVVFNLGKKKINCGHVLLVTRGNFLPLHQTMLKCIKNSWEQTWTLPPPSRGDKSFIFLLKSCRRWMDTLADCMMYHSKTATVENKTDLNFAVCVLCDTSGTAPLLRGGMGRSHPASGRSPFLRALSRLRLCLEMQLEVWDDFPGNEHRIMFYFWINNCVFSTTPFSVAWRMTGRLFPLPSACGSILMGTSHSLYTRCKGVKVPSHFP